MKKRSSGFTLVELIVVITILAILGTIGFVSLSGYTGQSRDTKRASDMKTLQSQMSVKLAEGLGILSLVDTANTQLVAGINVGGKYAGATEYAAGRPNFTSLGLASTNFQDPISLTPYRVGVATLDGGIFQIAAKIENGGTPQASIIGNYVQRNSAAKTLSATILTGATQAILSDSAVGFFNKGDTIQILNAAGTAAVTTSPVTISSIASDGKTINFSAATTSVSGTGVLLGTGTAAATAYVEAQGLIADRSNTATGIINGSISLLPYN